ncbi:hypothetical protein KBD59_04575 [Candidatus Gracilibacteria bacterium]|nr:hypothetical protein [Candidatus Gracilibacteria bacterium]
MSSPEIDGQFDEIEGVQDNAQGPTLSGTAVIDTTIRELRVPISGTNAVVVLLNGSRHGSNLGEGWAD